MLCVCFKISMGLPSWCSGWESACRCRGHGFEPWSGRIPHAAEQLGPCATATEPAPWSLCSTSREATATRSPCTATKSGPRSPQLEKDCTEQQRPNTAKNKINKINKFIKKKISMVHYPRGKVNICIQLTLEQHGFSLCISTYTRIFFQ